MKKCKTCNNLVGEAEEKACTHNDCPQQITGTVNDILTVNVLEEELDPDDFDKTFPKPSTPTDLQASGATMEDAPYTFDTIPYRNRR
jgi:hypothetical protein